MMEILYKYIIEKKIFIPFSYINKYQRYSPFGVSNKKAKRG